MAKPGQVPEGFTRLTFNLRKDLLKQLKLVAVEEEKSMTDVLVQLIEGYIRQHRPPRRKKE